MRISHCVGTVVPCSGHHVPPIETSIVAAPSSQLATGMSEPSAMCAGAGDDTRCTVAPVSVVSVASTVTPTPPTHRGMPP